MRVSFSNKQYRNTEGGGQKDIRVVYIDMEKAYDRMPREEMWGCARERNVPEKYKTLIQDMFRKRETKLRSVAGESSNFSVKVGYTKAQ